jgi:probable rRNA maturation factor
MKVSFFNRPKIVKESFLRKIIKEVLKGEQKQNTSLEIAFLAEKEIKRLNLRYRKKNRSTDVLSFAGRSGIGFPRGFWGKTLGQVIICNKVVKDNAKKADELFKRELARVLIHGTLHLLGYEHEKGGKKFRIMMAKQEKYLFHIK